MQREIKQAHNKEQRFRSDSGSDVGGKGVVHKLLYMVMISTVSGAALRRLWDWDVKFAKHRSNKIMSAWLKWYIKNLVRIMI